MDGQEEAAICLGEVSDSEEEGEGGWPTGWERERAGSPASWEGGGGCPSWDGAAKKFPALNQSSQPWPESSLPCGAKDMKESSGNQALALLLFRVRSSLCRTDFPFPFFF